jgi:hypothetical protein
VTFSRESLFPGWRLAGQFRVDLGQDVLVDDQIGTEDRGSDHAEVHLAGQEHLTQLREPLQQRRSVAHLRGRPSAADTQFGADLGSDNFPVIDAEEVVLTRHLLDAALGELAHRHQLARKRRPLGLLGITHQVE